MAQFIKQTIEINVICIWRYTKEFFLKHLFSTLPGYLGVC